MAKRYWNLTCSIDPILQTEAAPYRELGLINLTQVVEGAVREAIDKARQQHAVMKQALHLHEKVTEKGIDPDELLAAIERR